MANALGTLFQNIASAIRAKTGETGTMKPAEFPNKIAAIETGGGGESVMKFYGMTSSGLQYTIADSVTTIGDGKTFNSVVKSSIPDSVTVICAIRDDGYKYSTGCTYDLLSSSWVFDYRIHTSESLSVPYTGTLSSYTAPSCLEFVSNDGSRLNFTGKTKEGNGTLTVKTTAGDFSYRIIVG